MLRIELGLVLLALLIAAIRPTLGNRWFEKWEHHLSALGRRRALSVLLVGIAALGLRLAVLPVEPIPEPIVHDEFGYLLAADTFAHGRLTNPTPPMWEHFETFHVMFHPTYASIYPPAQGMILGLGKALFRNPFWGVWLSCGLMCAAITWMLQGWFTPGWALLGGVISVLRYGVFGYWADSYWGGAVAAIGGALVLGALPRIREFQRVRDALLIGVGLTILANSRPYEGFVFGLPVTIIFFVWLLRKKGPELRQSSRRLALPLMLFLSVSALGMGYYLWRVTGSPMHMPYQIDRATYAVAPYFIWQPVRPEPSYHHAVMRKMFVDEEMRALKIFRSPIGFLVPAYVGWNFFLGPALTLPFMMLALSLPRGFSVQDVSSTTKTLLGILLIFLLGSGLINFYAPHYSSPATGLIIALILLSIRQLRRWSAAGVFLARTIPVICALSLIVRSMAVPLHIPLREDYQFAWHARAYPSFGRAAIEHALQHMPGNQLVIVRYEPDHEPFAEWVYNDADIDHAKIVWVRDMGPRQNAQLISCFAPRTIWLLEADHSPHTLAPYPAEANSARSCSTVASNPTDDQMSSREHQ